MIKTYNIKINGKQYSVEVEEVSSSGVAVSSPVQTAEPAPVVQPSSQPASQPASEPVKAPVAAGANAVKAPVPGTILKVNCKAGDTIKKGDVLCVLEAMKMENDIKASEDGTVSAVHVTQGASVNTGDALVSF